MLCIYNTKIYPVLHQSIYNITVIGFSKLISEVILRPCSASIDQYFKMN